MIPEATISPGAANLFDIWSRDFRQTLISPFVDEVLSLNLNSRCTSWSFAYFHKVWWRKKRIWCSYKATWKSRHRYRNCKDFAPQYSSLCTVIEHQYQFATITHSLRYQSRGIHWCSRKNVAWFFRSNCQSFLLEQLLRKFLSKYSWWSPF